jgi:hypothetical protein
MDIPRSMTTGRSEDVQAPDPSDPREREVAYTLAQAGLEERDGASWITGLCSACWERNAYPSPPAGLLVRCSNGHLLRIPDRPAAPGS